MNDDILRANLAELSTEVAGTDLVDRVRAGAGRARARRMVVASVAVVAAVGVAAGTGFALAGRGTRQPPPPLTSPTPPPASVPPSAPGNSPTGTSAATGSTATPGGTVREADLLNATFDVPAMPSEYLAQRCPGGRRTFVNGTAPGTGTGTGQQATTYNIARGIPLLHGDLDGAPGDEYLVSVSCDGNGSIHATLLLALARDGSGWRTLGPVLPFIPGVGSPEAVPTMYDVDDVRITGRVVQVLTAGPWVSNGGPTTPEQLRGYRYDGTRFRQVSGPTEYPPWPAGPRQADLRNTTISLMGFVPCTIDCTGGHVMFVDGSGSDTTIVSTSGGTVLRRWYHYTIDQVTYLTFGGVDYGAVTVTRTAADGSTVRVVFAVYGTGPLLGARVVGTGFDGVTDIVGVRVATGGVLQVTVRTATGAQTRSYQPDANGVWNRVN